MIKLTTKNNTYFRLIETETNEFLGRCEIVEYSNKYELWSVRIFEPFQNQGYGTFMLKEIIKRYRKPIRTEKPLILYTWKDNEIAIKLYKKLGFKIISDDRHGILTMQFIK